MNFVTKAQAWMDGDENGDGELDLEEFEYQLKQPLTTKVFHALEIPLTDATELFKVFNHRRIITINKKSNKIMIQTNIFLSFLNCFFNFFSVV